MGVWQLFAVGLVLVLGLAGVVAPGVPGVPIVWAGLLWWALTEHDRPAWTLLVCATALLALAQVLTWTLPGRDPRLVQVPRPVLVRAAVGAVLGGLLLPVVGVFAGSAGALYVGERGRLGSFGAAAASTRAVLRAVGLSVLAELAACLLVVEGWLVTVAGWE